MKPANGSPVGPARAMRPRILEEYEAMTRIAVRLLALVALAVGLVGLVGFTSAQEMATPEPSAMPGMQGQHGMGGQGGHGMAGSGNGAAFFTVTNNGAEADRLVSASTTVAAVVEIHEIVDKDGLKEMRPLEHGLEIPAGATVTLAPGGYHIMMIGLTEDLNAGMTFELTLTFEKAGEVTVTVPVQRTAPTVDAIESIEVGDLTVAGAWSRPAPALLMGGTPEASPMASPMAGHSM